MTLKQDIMTNIINVGALVLALTEWVVPILTFVTLLFAIFWNVIKFMEWFKNKGYWDKITQWINKKRGSI